MRRLRVGILDLVTNEVPMRSLYGRVMNPNLSNIMPQMIAVWCERAGHEVTFVCYRAPAAAGDDRPARAARD